MLNQWLRRTADLPGAYGLPPGYRSRERHEAYLDVPGDLTFQPQVYDLLAFLVERGNLDTVVDIGAGSGKKLARFEGRCRIICVDRPEGLALARRQLAQATLIEANLEAGIPGVPVKDWSRTAVICADVIEHLQTPDKLAKDLARLSRAAPYVLVSTPDRERARGILDNGPPANPAHVREWSAGEFGRFLQQCGFAPGMLIGHTINSDAQSSKATTLVIAGAEAVPAVAAAPSKRVAAIMNVRDEVDILEESVAHLQRQGIEVHLFDDASSDGSWELANDLVARGLCAHAERFEGSGDHYAWEAQLRNTARHAASLKADWIIHHDADELRYAPWRNISLQQAFSWVDHLGYQAVDFTVLNFRYLAGRPDPQDNAFERSLLACEFGRRPGHFSQIKAWKNTGQPVDLHSFGGHEAVFPGRRVFPFKFLLKHYPLRSRAQAQRKAFGTMDQRAAKERDEKGWHTQYRDLDPELVQAGWNPSQLLAWHDAHFASEYLVERLSGIGIPHDAA